jgi:ABC-type transporter Mla subunit MlaD
MIRWLSISALLLALGWPAGAQAAPRGRTPAQMMRLNKAFTRLIQLNNRRSEQLRRLKRFQRTIRATRARPAGPARDFKLRRLLAGARVLAKSLSATDKQLAKALADLTAARMSLIQAMTRLKRSQQTRARRALVQTAGKGRGRLTVLRIAPARLHPLDGPREIEEKADLLKDSEEKIRKRLQEIDRVITRLNKRQKLRRIARGLDRYSGLFGEDTSRRRITRIRPARPAGASEPIAPAEGVLATNDMDVDAGYTNPGSTFGDDSPSHGGRSGTYAVVLKELLAPATLAALRKAGRSSDPRVRLQALRKAKAELWRAMTRLKARAQRYRAKARRLRQREQQRRRR